MSSKRTRDYQKTKVYRWENKLPTGEWLTFDEIEAYVLTVWEKEGLQWPPFVQKMHKNEKTNAGSATRCHMHFPEEGADEQTILHELAHVMTATAHGHCDGHGPMFVGVYMRLLCEHLATPLFQTMYTAQAAGIDYDLHAKVWIGK